MNPASVERKEIIGLHRITKKVLRNLCKKHQLYQTPELNDVLYLHYQGFQYIECLEEYTELKCLWLECNAISEIQGLQNQPKLKCLFLQNNLIKNIENLEHCKELDTLNLASNHIRKIENCGVEILPVLNTLNLSSNCLRDSESLRGLEECKTLSVLDLANNRIDDILVVKVFAKMPQLRVLVLQGNPVVSKIPQYRKTLILECKELTYLDSRPVFPKDRACAEAWKRGGYQEERKEQERWNRRDRKKIRDSVNATIRMRNKYKPVDDQMTLITSSDSENDEKRHKEARKRQEQTTDPRLLLETGEDIDDEETLLDIWDEVSGPNGVVNKVENENDEELESSEKQHTAALEERTANVENEPKNEMAEKLDIPEQVVSIANILKLVEKPMTDNNEVDDLPELVSDAEAHACRKRALIEEIGGSAKIVLRSELDKAAEIETHKESNSAQISYVSKEQQENSEETALVENVTSKKKRLLIEEVNNETRQPTYDEICSNELQATSTAKEVKSQVLELSEKYIEFDDKKPLWVDEIFSQSFVATPTPTIKLQEQTMAANISNEIEKEIKQGAIKKRRPILESAASNIEDFFKPVEKTTQLPGEFDLNFDELDAPEPESAEISDFEDIQNDQSFERFSKSLLTKKSNNENKKTELFDYFKLSPNDADDQSLKSNKQALVEEIVNEQLKDTKFGLNMAAELVDEITKVEVTTEKDVKTKELLLNSLIEEIDEVLHSCKASDLDSNEAPILAEYVKDTYVETSETNIALNKREAGEDFDDLSLISENIERISKQLEKDYNLSIGNVETLQKCLDERPTLHKISLVEPIAEENTLDTLDAAFVGDKTADAEVSKNLESVDLLESDTDSELSNASDDLVSDTPSDDEETWFNKRVTSNPAYLNEPVLETSKESALKYDNEISATSESEDETAKLKYNDAANAICDAVMSRVGAHEQPEVEKTYFMTTTETNDISVGNYEPELEMQRILERLPDDEAAARAKRLEPDDEFIKDVVVKTEEEIKYDVECEEVNQQVTKDFEALNSNMEYFIEQFQHEQEQIKGEFKLKVEEQTNEVKFAVVDEVDENEARVFKKIVETKQITFQQSRVNDDNHLELVCEETVNSEKVINPDVFDDKKLITDSATVKNEELVADSEAFKNEELFTGSETVKNSELVADSETVKNEEIVTDTEAVKNGELVANSEAFKHSELVAGSEAFKNAELVTETEAVKNVELSTDSEPVRSHELITVNEPAKNDNLITINQLIKHDELTADYEPVKHEEMIADLEPVSRSDIILQYHVPVENASAVTQCDPAEEPKHIHPEIIETEETKDFPCEINATTKMSKYEAESISIENTDLVKACGDHAGIGETTEKLPFIELEEILERPTLKAYEQEAIELKALLQKLELQNEKLTFVKKTCDELLMSGPQETSSDEENTEDSYHDAEEGFENSTELVNDVITEIVEDAVDKGVEKTQVKKPKNYVITDLESDEEYSYSGPPKPAEPPVKSIRSVLGAFHNLIQDIARKNRAEKQRERVEFESKRVPTSKAEKLESLQTLLKTPSLLEHHRGTYMELTPQADAINQRNTDELKQMVERVYAQKDKYDDSLEVVDGRLVVIKKETGQVEEVITTKQKAAYGSDEEYESANSSYETESEEKVSKDLIWDFNMGAVKPHTWVPKYRPTMRKSAEQLILNAIESDEEAQKLAKQYYEDEENAENANDDDDDAKTLRQVDTKSSVFSNIDEEFFDNLNFKKIAEESAKDENFVEIARSYEELKQIIKQSGMESARSTLTDEEQNIVEMFDKNVEEKSTNNDTGNDEFTQVEDALMHKLVQRTKEAKERGEDLLNTEIEQTDKPFVISREQLNSLELNKQDCDSDQETLVDEVTSNKTLTFETEPEMEIPKNLKVVKMLQKLRSDDAIAKDLLQEKDKKLQDFGDFTTPLDPNFEHISLEGKDVDSITIQAQADYAAKLAAYKKIKLEKRLSIASSEKAIQCEPSNFMSYQCTQNLEIESFQSSDCKLQLEPSSNIEFEKMISSSSNTDTTQQA